MRLWRIQVHELIQLACQIANRNLTQDEWQRLLGNTPYHKTCVDLPVHPSVYKALLKETEELTKQGKITSALETLAKVQRLEPAAEIPADTWYRLCWFGSLWEAATEVMHACEKAVELFPDNGIVHQGRGLARALTGNFAGAVEDFNMYLEWAPKNNQSEEDISLRQQWTEALKAHQKPLRCRDSEKTSKPVEPLQAPRHSPLCCVVCLRWEALPLAAVPSRISATPPHGPCQVRGVACGWRPVTLLGPRTCCVVARLLLFCWAWELVPSCSACRLCRGSKGIQNCFLQ